MGNGDPETNEESSTDEHAESEPKALEGNASYHDRTPYHNASASSQHIRSVWYSGQCDKRANSPYTIKKTELRRRGGMIIVSPLLKTLKAIHHRTIVSICRRCQNDEQQTDVQSPHSLLFIPGDSGEALPRQLERVLRVERVHIDGGGERLAVTEEVVAALTVEFKTRRGTCM